MTLHLKSLADLMHVTMAAYHVCLLIRNYKRAPSNVIANIHEVICTFQEVNLSHGHLVTGGYYRH